MYGFNELITNSLADAVLPETIKVTPKSVKSAEPKKEIEKPVIVQEDPIAESPKIEEEPPAKKIDLEITNPDDIEIDDKGQLGLF